MAFIDLYNRNIALMKRFDKLPSVEVGYNRYYERKAFNDIPANKIISQVRSKLKDAAYANVNDVP